MTNRALQPKTAAWTAGAGLASLIVELILVGVPGPCAVSGVLDSYLHRWPGFENWLAYLWVVGSLLVILLGLVWFVAAVIVGRIDRPHPPAV